MIGYIIFGVFILLIIISFVIGKIIHNKFFKNRYVSDPDINYFDYHEYNAKTIPFKTGDDKKYLKGNLYYKESYDKDKIIVYSHGMFSDHVSYMQDICYFVEQGYLVLGFDYYGTSLSSGKNLKSFGNSLESLNDVITYIKNNNELKNKEIYVVGHSWGGYSTSNIVKFHPDIKGICAISPFNSCFDLINSFVPKQLKFLSLFIYLIDLIRGGKYSVQSAIESLNNYQGRVLLIQSTDDGMVKYDIGVGKIKNKTTNNNIKYIIINNRKHNPNYTDEAIKEMIEFNNNISKMNEEEVKNYKRNYDFHKMGELDQEIMGKIRKFVINGEEI